jgi:hypothetical protein
MIMTFNLNDKKGVRSFLDQIVQYGKIETLMLHTGFLDARERFQFYHLHRNYFNFETETGLTLTAVRYGTNEFKDNSGRRWSELTGIKNYFHMPLADGIKATMGIGEPWSRKFISDDTTDLGGEYELIVRGQANLDHSSEKNGKYQATYNYGRTRDERNHAILDVLPHKFLGSSYEPYSKTKGDIFIQDFEPVDFESKSQYTV